MKNEKRLAVIGIDGATFDIISPMVEVGELPTLGRLMSEGVYGELNSTIPPMTPPAWSSFATGLNPGKHGIFDFTERVPGTYSIRFVNASMRNGKSMWTAASDAGKRVAVMAVPFTYPPERVNGIMISGIDAPGVGDKGDPSVMYPTQLYDEIARNVGPYIIASNPMNDIYHGNMKSALDKILNAVETKGNTAKYLLSKDDWDLFVMVFGETDLVGHHFWRYHDPNSPFYEETFPEVNNAVKTVYATIDRKIAEMLSKLPEDTSVMIVSDHGFGGNNDIIVCMNKVLEDLGFLKFKSFSSKDYLLSYVLDKAKKFGLKLTPPAIKKMLIKKQWGGIVNKMESTLRFSLIDWSQTVAYSEETPYFPSVWINLEGREPEGIVTGSQYDEIREEIKRKLTEYIDPITGSPLLSAAYNREEIYTGAGVEKSPDIVFDWNNPNGYSYISRPSLYSKNEPPLRRLSVKELKTDRFRNKSGNHRQFGIFIASGGVFKKGGSVEGAEIIDIAPTVLYVQGVPIPSAVDGKILTSVISPQFLAERKPVFSDEVEQEIDTAQPYTKEESEIISKRLRDLGYLD